MLLEHTGQKVCRAHILVLVFHLADMLADIACKRFVVVQQVFDLRGLVVRVFAFFEAGELEKIFEAPFCIMPDLSYTFCNFVYF